jgi:hypothetical protein
VSFIKDGAEGAVALAVEKIRRNEDHGAFDPRPEVDEKQQKEFLAAARDGRTPFAYQQALEHAGFVFHVPACRCRACLHLMNPEGIWRHNRMMAAFTPNDVTTLFTTPEKLDLWIKERKLTLKLQKRNAKKVEIVEATSRLVRG